ncbi:hypothetical protein [Akkermansia muciniphila]|nr:hypothetical protein [Akkermansia muciniphila]PNC83650.1 hypothetical protein CXT93_09030 [Akkermansia muciniphila]PNC95870.1 hypothetical protein CXT87_11250 [Akkermansia muciniphila]PND06489.1 hypothetical protein CXT86_03885 [Akkermansia muciniphila]PND09500.1 hypothetical protein CXT85_08315 [Akkermansia muciniphila]
MIKIILFELTRILLGYASDKVGEFIRNKQRNGPRPPSFDEEEEEDPWSQHPPSPADSMTLAQLLQAIYNLIARR